MTHDNYTAYDPIPPRRHDSYPSGVKQPLGHEPLNFAYQHDQPHHDRRSIPTSHHTESWRKSTKNSQPKQQCKATEEDASRAGIPAGYSIQHWDPVEEPVVLMRKVFDANSLGKWIFDWTNEFYTAKHSFFGMADDLWLLLLKLAGKKKSIKEGLPDVRSDNGREMATEFLAAANRLCTKLETLLKDCEKYMWDATRHKSNESASKTAAVEFVKSLFGRERLLDRTEKLMQSIRAWDFRLDANLIRPGIIKLSSTSSHGVLSGSL